MSTVGGVVRSSAAVALGTALSRLTGLARLAALAYAMGFTRLTDTYNLANTTPNIVYELLLGGVLSATLVPTFVDHHERGDEEATSAVVTVAAAVLVALTTIGVLAAPAIVRLYTIRVEGDAAAAQQEVATALLRLFMPQMLFYGLIALATALLHAHRRFAAPAFSPVLNNLIVTGVFLALPEVAGQTPTLDAIRDDGGLVLLLGLGTTAGVAAMALALIPALRGAGIRLRPVLEWRHPAVRRVLALSGWTVGYVASNQLALWLVLVLANASAGGVAAYQGAFVFFQLPHGLVAVSLMTTLTPELALAASRADMPAFRRQFLLGVRFMSLAILPAAAGYLVMARPVVGFLLERGALTDTSADLTARCLGAFAAGLLPFSLYLYALRGFYALRDTRTPFLLNCFENGLNIALALVLEPSLGVPGLALAYAGAYAVAAVVALRALHRRTATDGGGGSTGGDPGTGSTGPERATAASLARMVAAAAVMAVAVRAGLALVPEGRTVAEVVTGVLVGIPVYVLTLAALRGGELGELLSRRRHSPA
ncbi:MAG TPA: murein biosynthesis integral membrane protein MurJ [Acidimicrobiia bacterium]|nr:murein biosynthesis integral membrane protein MurJ [Acidimicrobiia bacterium]